MDVAALVIACIAIGLSALSVSWQIYTWRRERRFDVRVRIVFEGASLGTRRYPIRVVVSNHGGTDEAIERLWIKATFDHPGRDPLNFYAPELVRNPSRDRSLPPRRRFESHFNLLAVLIGATHFPTRVEAFVELESGRQASSEPYETNQSAKDHALEAPPEGLDLPEGVLDDYFPEGPFQICPDCKSEIPVDARVCRACGYRFARRPP
jgi:hypothetical protein